MSTDERILQALAEVRAQAEAREALEPLAEDEPSTEPDAETDAEPEEPFDPVLTARKILGHVEALTPAKIRAIADAVRLRS